MFLRMITWKQEISDMIRHLENNDHLVLEFEYVFSEDIKRSERIIDAGDIIIIKIKNLKNKNL